MKNDHLETFFKKKNLHAHKHVPNAWNMQNLSW